MITVTPRRSAALPAALLALGAVLVGVSLYWDRIALGGQLGRAPEWMAALSAPIELVTGAIARDEPGARQLHRLDQLAGSWALATAAYFLALWLCLRTAAGRCPRCRDVVLAVAIVCRVVLAFSPPLLETDPYRYLWDGAVLAAGEDPYRFAPLTVRLAAADRALGAEPSDPALSRVVRLTDDPALARLLPLINHPAIPTCYPPAALALFALSARARPGDVFAWKALVLLADLALLALLVRVLDAYRRPAGLVVLYAWCPLVLKEYAQTGHHDVFAMLAVTAALLALARDRRVLAGLALGAAVLVKLYAVVVAVALARSLSARGLSACALLVIAGWAPFAAAGATTFAGLSTYARDWTRNASLYVPLEAALGPSAARAAAGLAVAAVALALAARREAPARELPARATTALAALFLLSPVCFPWYCGWLLPLAALEGRVSFSVLSGTMLAYYMYFRDGSWGPRVDLRWLEYLPFFALFLAERLQGAGGTRRAQNG